MATEIAIFDIRTFYNQVKKQTMIPFWLIKQLCLYKYSYIYIVSSERVKTNKLSCAFGKIDFAFFRNVEKNIPKKVNQNRDRRGLSLLRCSKMRNK